MKKSILILCACAAFAGCSEDDLVVKKPAIPGSEVQFGATAYMSNGNGTRTVYGDADATNGKIELRWVVGDKIDIACKQAAEGRRKAAYKIVETTIVGDENSIDNSQATKLEKVGEYGIQWGEPGNHDFYALYPSSESFDATERGKIGIDADGVNGYLPVNQEPKDVTEVTKDGKTNYILEPDMRYAFMVAKNSVNSAEVNTVSLSFKPLVTALQFELTAPKITNNTTESTELTITAVSLNTVNEQNICGDFQYKFKNNTITDTNEGTGFSRITQTIPSNVKLNAGTGNKVDVTFFVLPSANIADGNLRLQVFYNYNGSPYVKTLLIGKDLEARKKYYFRNVQLHQIDAKVQGSSWFSALDPNVYISQLSIPVAGNTFSNYYSGDNKQYYQEQTLDYTELWNKGVRGFEFCTSYDPASSSLDTCKFVCNATPIDAVNFGDAFSMLAGQLDKEGFKKECLIVIATYKSYTGGGAYNPQQYVTQLENFLKMDKYKKSIADKLVKLTPQSTVGELQGKIAIIIRPGDDDYSSTQELKVSNSKLTLVKDWGTAVDKWDKRFGETYKSEGAFSNGGSLKVEDCLWGVSSSTSSYIHSGYVATDVGYFKTGYPTDNNFSFDHTTNTDQIVHVQEWARIIPSGSFATTAFYSGLTAKHVGGHETYLWLRWPESYSQKQAMIEATVAASMATKGGTDVNKLFINSLCGYYPVKALPASYYPYNTKYTYDCQGGHILGDIYSPSFTLTDAGAGGDYVTCAYDLNKWFYTYLTETNTDVKTGLLKQGPVGLVMLNHIGTTAGGSDDKSLDLVNWIMMNNFKFPLSTAPSEDVQGGGIGEGGANTGGGAE